MKKFLHSIIKTFTKQQTSTNFKPCRKALLQMFDVDIIYTADSFIDSLTVLLTAEITI